MRSASRIISTSPRAASKAGEHRVGLALAGLLHRLDVVLRDMAATTRWISSHVPSLRMPLDEDDLDVRRKTRHALNRRFDVAALVARRNDDRALRDVGIEVPQRTADRVMAQAEHCE